MSIIKIDKTKIRLEITASIDEFALFLVFIFFKVIPLNLKHLYYTRLFVKWKKNND